MTNPESLNFPRTPAASTRPTEPFSSPEGPTDSEIVARVIGGDRDAYRVLVERYQGKVFNMALGYLLRDREKAADAAQEVFLKAYRGLSGFQQNAKFSTWLHRIAINHFISEIRKERAQKRGRPISLNAPLSTKKGDDDLSMQVGNRKEDPILRLQNEERGRKILEALQSLDEDLQTLLTLCDVQELPYEEIAEITGVPVGTVRSRLHRARERLREKLKRVL